MCRRRLLKSNFYINYGGTKKAHGETVIVSPFVAGGDSDSFELYTRNPWVITNNLSWLTVSSLSNKSGKYTITITAAENQAYSERNGVFTAKTLDDRFSIVISVSQQAKPSVRYIEIVPATASISSLGTTSFTCILHDNGTETDVTNLVEWSSSDTNAATISNGSATGCNNTKTEKQVTITAEYDGLSATATLNVAAGVVSWRNYRILIGAIESTKNSPVNLDATNISSSVSIGSYIDEYVNEVKLQTWSSTESSTWSIGDDTVARLEKETETSREVYSVYNSGAFYPNTRTTEITATTTYGSQTFTATKIVNVAPQGLVTHYISVEPTTATIGSTGEVQLTVLYHTVTDGVDDGGVDVTTSAGYTDNGSDLIDVNATGKVSGSGSETGGNATVTVSYPDVESVDVSITVRDATVDYRNFRVIPLSMTLGKDDVTTGEQIQAYVDVFVNNVFSEELEVTADASWSSKNTNVASVSKSGTNEVVKPVYGSGYFPTTRTTQIQASYLGSAATCDVTVEPEGRIERYIEVTPSSVALGATGSESLKVKLYTKTDGVVDAGVDVTTSCSYASDSQIITVNDSGVVTANNTGETEVTANITVSYSDVDSVIVPAVSSPANIEHELLLEPQGNTTLGFEEDCAFKLYYITKINGTEVSREEVTSNITWDPIAEEKGRMTGTTFVNEWFSTAQTTVDVCATYNGIKSNNVVLTLNGAESITHTLVITPSDSNINYNGTSQMSAEYVTYVNGTEYSREPVQPSDVSWSENSTASTISNSGLLTANNTSSSSTVSATVTGTYNGVSGTANVTIGNAPGIDVSTPSNWHLSSGAGSDEFYVKWVNLKPNTTIVLNHENIVSYSPVEIPITSSNYTGGTVTINFSYDENPNEEPRKIYLYATGTGFSNETKTDSDYFEQSAKTIERNIQVSVDGKVTSNEGGTCDYVLVSWTGLTVGTWIDVIGTNAGVSPEIQVTATTGSVQLNNQPSVTENEGSSRTIRVDAKWREDNSVSGYDSWTQNGDYVPPVVYTYELEITPEEPGTQPYSGSQAFVATLYRLNNGTRDGWSENVTERVDWNISTVGGDFIKSDITTGGIAEWVNLSSSTGQVTVSAWLDEPEYGSPSSNEVVFTVNGVSITSTLTLTPLTTTLDYGESVTYTATVTISHGSTTVFSRTYTFDNWDPDVLSIAPDSNTYLTHDVKSKFDYSNASEQETSVTITCSYRETVAEFLPSGAHVDGAATVVLNEYVEPVDTYSVTFVCSPFAEEVSYTSTNGRSGDNHGVTNWTSTGFYDGDTISYTATKTGYSDVTGTATINGADLVINIVFQEESTVPIRLYYTKETNDSKTYIFTAKLMTVDNTWSQTFTGQTDTTDNATKTLTFNVPESKTGQSFTYVFTKMGGDSYDSVSFGGPAFSGIREDTLSDLNNSIGSTSFNSLDYATLKFEVCYSITGEITLNAENATLDYSSIGIYQDGLSYVTFAGPHAHGDITCAITYDKCIANISSKVYIGGGILDTAKYNNFYIQIYSSKGGTVLYSGPAAGLVRTEGGGINLMPSQVDGSYWLLSTRAINMTTQFANAQSDLPGSIADAYIYPYSSYDAEPLTTIYRIGELGTHSGFLDASGIDQNVALALGGSITNGAYTQYHLKIVSSTSDIVFDNNLSTVAPQPGYTGDIIPLGYTATRYIENCTWIWTKLY